MLTPRCLRAPADTERTFLRAHSGAGDTPALDLGLHVPTTLKWGSVLCLLRCVCAKSLQLSDPATLWSVSPQVALFTEVPRQEY